MGYLSYLIQCNLFDTIEMNFLPVGHTHTDVDGMFGNFSPIFKSNNAFTLEDMQNLIKNYLKDDLMMFKHIDRMVNITNWMHQNNHLNDMKGKLILK